MNLFVLPWLELSVLIPLIGAVCLARMRDEIAASWWALVITGATLVCTLMLMGAYWSGTSPSGESQFGFFPAILGYQPLAIDGLSAPLLPLVALLHFLTVLATARTKMVRFSFAWMLLSESIRLALFACMEPWLLIGLLALISVPPYLELRKRGRPTRVYVIHMVLFVSLMVGGWACATSGEPGLSDVAAVLLLAAILIRCGTVPVHLWVADLVENCSFGTGLLFIAPIAGVYAAVRLVIPFAPDWTLQVISIFSLITAVYAAGLAVVQQNARRFFAYVFLSHGSLVLVGLELHTVISLTGALFLWISVALSLAGLGLTLRAVEARFGRLALNRYHGLYEHSPALAVCFLLTGLGSVGFPGTLGYVAAELLVDGAIEVNIYVGIVVALASALNGIAVIRVYFLLFTGSRHVSAVSLGITPRERFAVLTLAGLILGGGLYPQPGVQSRHLAAESLLRQRAIAMPAEAQPHADASEPHPDGQ